MAEAVEMKVLHTLEDGREVILPMPTERQVPPGIRRKSRQFSGGRQKEEIFYLLLEHFLTEEQLEVWDTLDGETMASVIKKADALEVEKD